MIYNRFKFVSYLILSVVIILALRLFQLQVLDETKYQKLSENNRLRIFRTAAARGIIFDRNGVPLVKNIPILSVSISPEKIENINKADMASILGMTLEHLEERIQRNTGSLFVPIK
ncbi:MAG: hypothetical protein L0Y62_04725, partial [Nitrospirae bacterium]|nr:hypothetical protein [Nitrospirota bacterium]